MMLKILLANDWLKISHIGLLLLWTMVNGNIIETRKRPTTHRESSIFASQFALCLISMDMDMKIMSN